MCSNIFKANNQIVVFHNDFFGGDLPAPRITIDNVLNAKLEEIAHKYNVAFYQADAACSVFMCMLNTHNKVRFNFDGKNDKEIIANLLETCPVDTFIEHYYKTFMSKVINSNKFNVPVEGNKTLFSIIFKVAYKSFMFDFMFTNNTNGLRDKIIGDCSPICQALRVYETFERYLHTA